jgi:hypothetical protein
MGSEEQSQSECAYRPLAAMAMITMAPALIGRLEVESEKIASHGGQDSRRLVQINSFNNRPQVHTSA